jgi:hypothetical protein
MMGLVVLRLQLSLVAVLLFGAGVAEKTNQSAKRRNW